MCRLLRRLLHQAMRVGGQAVRVPPLRLEEDVRRSAEGATDDKTRDFLKSITLHEDADVLVLNKPMGLAVQGGRLSRPDRRPGSISNIGG